MNTSIINDFMATIGIIILVIVGSTSALFLLLQEINAYLNRQEQKRKELLKGYTFPTSCYLEVQQRYPHLTTEHVNIAFEQLRLYFEVCLVHSSPNSANSIAMPSKLVDVCWHSFICETREYQGFCKSAFGGFLHHESRLSTTFPLVLISEEDIQNGENKASPSEAQAQQARDFKNQLSAARIYHWALYMGTPKQSFDVVNVPFLFSIDREFNIEDGYFYTSEVLEFLAKFDLKAVEALLKKRETETASGSAAACGDGGSCGGCGGSV